MRRKISTAVFPVAGLGLRFLPITKSGPKEMLPIVDRPLIQYVVEEALSVGINQLIFVTNGEKRAIEDYFDKNYELERRLEERGKFAELSELRSILPSHISVVYIRQPEPLGLGDAVLRTKNIIGNNPFVVLLADDIMDYGAHACLRSMMDTYEKNESSVLAVESVPLEETYKYGIVTIDNPLNAESMTISSIVEKPMPEEAPSNLAVTGRYILTPRIFEFLESIEKGHGGEVQLTDAIAKLLNEEKVFACPLKGKRFDCGSPQGFLQATISFAMKRPEFAHFKKYLRNILDEVGEISEMEQEITI